MSELLPCPFCGGTEILDVDCSESHSNGTRIYCAKCGASVEGFGRSDYTSKAIAAWNTRAPAAPVVVVPPEPHYSDPWEPEGGRAEDRRDNEWLQALRAAGVVVRGEP